MNSIMGWVAANPVLTDISMEAARRRPKVGGTSLMGLGGLCCCLVVVAIVVVVVVLVSRRKKTPPR